jgi:hypothetical protein
MNKLMEIASQEARVTETDGSNLPQVHAYNCLKEIFKSSYLTAMGNKSEKFLPQCLELAANGLKSELWAIRNCGLILLRSLIDCLFGSHQSKALMEAGWDGKANRIAYHRYLSLPGTLFHLLKSGHQMMTSIAASSAAAESVFPALDIIRRAGPPEVLREELQIHIAKYLASPVWHVREIAARTLCSCLLHAQWLDTITSIAAESVRSQIGNVQNHVHGVLLALKYIVDRLSEVMPEQLQREKDYIDKLENPLTRTIQTTYPSSPVSSPSTGAKSRPRSHLKFLPRILRSQILYELSPGLGQLILFSSNYLHPTTERGLYSGYRG